jgi:hypothetical protein
MGKVLSGVWCALSLGYERKGRQVSSRWRVVCCLNLRSEVRIEAEWQSGAEGATGIAPSFTSNRVAAHVGQQYLNSHTGSCDKAVY